MAEWFESYTDLTVARGATNNITFAGNWLEGIGYRAYYNAGTGLWSLEAHYGGILYTEISALRWVCHHELTGDDKEMTMVIGIKRPVADGDEPDQSDHVVLSEKHSFPMIRRTGPRMF